VCTRCDFICLVDGCLLKGGCDAIAVAGQRVFVVEAKSGNVSREDAKDAARQLERCVTELGLYPHRRRVVLVLLYGRRLEKPAREYLRRECGLRKRGLPVVWRKCGRDLSEIP